MADNQGSCLCGTIRWVIDAEPTLMPNCHCSMCRKAHGSAFGTFAGVAPDNFRWISGKDTIATYESSPGALRPFCPRCGSVVPSEFDALVFTPAGNLDGPIARPLDNQIFTGSMAPWWTIHDTAELFEAYPPGYAAAARANMSRPPATAGATAGSCLCGAVAFEFTGAPDRMGCCHCSRCRKSRSAAFSTQVFVPTDRFRWVRGEHHVKHYKVPESQFFVASFCATCGSPMPRVFDDGTFVTVPAGPLDQDPGARPQGHIYVASKAPWVTIDDGLPQFEEMPPGM
jgi:hypothetical protein